MKTITVTDYFGGEREVTREEYIERWLEHAREFRKIGWSHPKEVELIEKMVAEMAGAQFDK